MKVDSKVCLDREAPPSSRTARRKLTRAGRGLSTSLFAEPFIGVLGIEPWLGSSFNSKGVRRTKLPRGTGGLLAMAMYMDLQNSTVQMIPRCRTLLDVSRDRFGLLKHLGPWNSPLKRSKL